MTTNAKIFLGITFAIFIFFGFINFELAVQAHNNTITNAQEIDSIKTQIIVLQNQLQEKQDTTIIKNYVIIHNKDNNK